MKQQWIPIANCFHGRRMTEHTRLFLLGSDINFHIANSADLFGDLPSITHGGLQRKNKTPYLSELPLVLRRAVT